MRTIKIVQILIVLICFISCSSEENGVTLPSIIEDETIPLQVPFTKSINGADSTNRVKTVRMIITKDGRVTNNIKKSDLTVDSISVVIQDSVPVGKVNYYLIANEDSFWDFDLINIDDYISASLIKEKVLNFSAYPVVNKDNHIPMFGMYEGLNITSDSKAYYEGTDVTNDLGKLTRLYVKASLELKCIFNDLPNKQSIELKSLSIKSMPKKSYLAPTYYNDGAGFFDGAFTDITNTNYILSSTGFSGDFEFYLPEHIVTDTINKTYISAVVRMVSDPTKEREYRIVLGDSIIRNDNNYMLNDASFQGVRVSRNTHYLIKAAIKSYEESAGHDMEIVTTVINWETTNTDDNDIWKYDLKVSQDEFYIDGSNEYDGVIHIKTNYPSGWSVKGSTGVSFENSIGSYVSTLDNQTGETLKFKLSTGGLSGSIDITAGPIVKRIKLTRY